MGVSNRLTEAELNEFFDRLFPGGFAGVDVIEEIAPGPWGRSPLFNCFHPTPDAVVECQMRWHESVQEFRRLNGLPSLPSSSEPTLAGLLEEWDATPVHVPAEVANIVATCLWDIFSNNNRVTAADGRVVDIGTSRSAYGFLEARSGISVKWEDEHNVPYSLLWVSRRVGLGPVFRMIFRRLKGLGADWRYTFPRWYLMGMDQGAIGKPATDSVSDAFAKAQEEGEDENHNTAVRKALEEPPPILIQSYEAVFGLIPSGWPPSV